MKRKSTHTHTHTETCTSSSGGSHFSWSLPIVRGGFLLFSSSPKVYTTIGGSRLSLSLRGLLRRSCRFPFSSIDRGEEELLPTQRGGGPMWSKPLLPPLHIASLSSPLRIDDVEEDPSKHGFALQIFIWASLCGSPNDDEFNDPLKKAFRFTSLTKYGRRRRKRPKVGHRRDGVGRGTRCDPRESSCYPVWFL